MLQVLGPAMLAVSVALIMVFNSLRWLTRYGPLRGLLSELDGGVRPADVPASVLSMPGGRGTFVASLMEDAASLGLRLIALDAYETPYCREDARWIGENSVRELEKHGRGSAEAEALVRERVSVVRRNALLALSLPFPSHSLDRIFWMFPLSNAELSDNRDSARVKAQKTARLYGEMLRVLRPGGRLRTVGFFFSVRAAEQSMRDAGFTDVRTLPATQWLSFMPSYCTEGTAPRSAALDPGPEEVRAVDAELQRFLDAHGALVTSSGADSSPSASSPSSLSGGLTPIWLTTSASASSSKSSEAPYLDDESSSPSSSGSSEARSVGRALAEERSIRAAGEALQWLRWALLACAALLWLALAVAITLAWAPLNWPAELSWDSRANSQFWGNVKGLPIAFVFMAGDMNALLVEGVPVREPSPVSRGWLLDLVAPYSDPHALPRFRPPTHRDLLDRFGAQLVSVLLALTLFNAIFWVPVLLIDLAIVRSVSASTMTTINTVLYIALIFAVVHGARFVAARLAPSDSTEDDKATSGDQLDAPLLQNA
jgi:SAM-dependent methyltransferase